jgi:uncharacterized integral membrane protein
MRLLGIFFWIAFGAIVLWFFTLNLGENVDLNLFGYEVSGVNLVMVFFLTLFVGVILGALILVAQVFKARSQLNEIRKENSELLKEIENLQRSGTPQAGQPAQENS